jgi:hypothetical protein
MKPTLPATLAFGLLLAAQNSRSEELEIDAGSVARDHSIVTFDPSAGMAGGSTESRALKAEDGRTFPVYMTPAGKLAFIAPPLAAGAKLTLKPDTTARFPERIVTQKPEGSRIDFSYDGKAVASYQCEAKESPRPGLDPRFLRGGYLHPLRTPSGKTVTDDYPVNHLHHHGVWMAWTKAAVDGRETDFWNMGQGKGRVDFLKMDSSWSLTDNAGIIAHQKYTDLTSGSPLDVLDEKWTVSVPRPAASYNIIDLESEQVPLNGKTLELPIYHYGGIGIRGLEAWNGKGDAATFTTSENVTDRIKMNGQPARWIRMTGKVEGGGLAGIAILSHPENYRSPQPVRIHPTEPFISFAPQTNAAMAIKPGETYRSRYRFIISDGEVDAALLERLWQDYAHPITAKWVK